MTFFTLPSNYAEFLHKKLFSLIFNSNGGFTWNDVYYMPIKLREFYWRELLSYKDAEKEAYENMANSGKTQIGSGRVTRK